MGEDHNVERRKYLRIPSSDVVSFSEMSMGEKMGVTKDLSPGGIRFFATGCEIEQESVLQINFYVGETFVTAVGKVIHATDVDALTQDIGLEFVEIDPIASAILRNSNENQTAPTRGDSDPS